MAFKTAMAIALLMVFAQAPAVTAGQTSGAHPPQQSIAAAGSPSAQGAAPASASPQENQHQAGATSCVNGNCDVWPAQVRVADAPPLAPFWPLHERILWAALLILVVLGYVGIMISVSTLKKIARQTEVGEAAAAAAAESARAALLHAEAIVQAERPWILVSVEPTPGVMNGFTVIASNRGRTPARIVAIPHKIEFAEDESRLPEVPQYQDPNPNAPFVPIILIPGEHVQITTFCREDVRGFCASDEQFDRVTNWEERIFLYGRVTYRDLVSPQDEQVRQSAWCFWYIHGHQNSGMVPAGPRNYNLHT